MQVLHSFSHWLRAHFGELDAVVFDIDGVLTVEGRPTPGASELLNTLSQKTIAFTLLTNDACHSPAEKSASLRKIGIPVDHKDIVSSGDSLLDFVVGHGLSHQLFFVMGVLGDPCYALKAGLQVTRRLEDLSRCRGVIVGEDRYDWEGVFNAVVNFFMAKPKAMLITPNPDEYFPLTSGRIQIGPGAVARFIQRVLTNYGLPVEPLYLGKPYLPIFERNHSILMQKMGRKADRDRVWMVGDFIDSDIRGARDFGYRSALVLTGLTSRQSLDRSGLQPDLVFERLG
jgi:HAD superfamily hydrolase (TIGR01450 family)